MSTNLTLEQRRANLANNSQYKKKLSRRQSIDDARNNKPISIKDRLAMMNQSKEEWKTKYNSQSENVSKLSNVNFGANKFDKKSNNMNSITQKYNQMENDKTAIPEKLREERQMAEKQRLEQLEKIRKEAVESAYRQLQFLEEKLLSRQGSQVSQTSEVSENNNNNNSNSISNNENDWKSSENNDQPKSPDSINSPEAKKPTLEFEIEPEFKITQKSNKMNKMDPSDDLFSLPNNTDYKPRHRANNRRAANRKNNFGAHKKIHQMHEDKIDYGGPAEGKYDKSALKGLQETVDFTSEKAKLQDKSKIIARTTYPQFRYPMLMEIKCNHLHDNKLFCRLVQCNENSLKNNDTDEGALILVPDSSEIFAFYGKEANHLIKAKTNEIVRYIVANHNFGLRNPKEYKIDDSKRNEDSSSFVNKSAREKFFKNLRNSSQTSVVALESSPLQTDEIISNLHTYKFDVKTRKFTVFENACGQRPSMNDLYPNLEEDQLENGDAQTSPTSANSEILNKSSRLSESIYLFDFWNEVYFWTGQKASKADKTTAFEQAKIIYDLRIRPEWALFAKVQEEMEAALFQEKFYDWSNKFIFYKKYDEAVQKQNVLLKEREKVDSINPVSYFPEEIKHDICKLATTGDGLNLLDVSSGDGQIRDSDGRILQIITEKIEIIKDGDFTNPPMIQPLNLSKRQRTYLCQDNSYVVKWNFRIAATGKFVADDDEFQFRDENRQNTGNFDFGEKVKTSENTEAGSQHEIIFVWFGSEVPSPSKLPILDRLKAPRKLNNGQEPLCFFRCLEPVQIVSDKKSDEYFRKFTTDQLIFGSNFEIFQDQASKPDYSVQLWKFNQLGKRLMADSVTSFDKKVIRCENYHSVLQEQTSVVMIGFVENAKNSKISSKIFIIHSNSVNQSTKNLAKLSAENLLKQKKNLDIDGKYDNILNKSDIEIFEYGNEPDWFKTQVFPVWVEAEIKEFDEENMTFVNKKLSATGTKSIDVNNNDQTTRTSDHHQIYTLDQLQNFKKNKNIPENCQTESLEVHLSDEEFYKHTNMTKEQFYQEKTWKQLQIRKKLSLF